VLRIDVQPVGDRLFGAPSNSATRARALLAPPKGRPCLYVYIIECMKSCCYGTVQTFFDIWLTNFLDCVKCPLFKTRNTKMLVQVLSQKVMGRTNSVGLDHFWLQLLTVHFEQYSCSTAVRRMRRFLAVLRSFFHSCHSSPPTIYPFSLTLSCHLFLGLPLSLVVSKWIYNTLLGILFSCILCTCPNQYNLCNHYTLTM
jgi:hypothetical protein